MSQNRPNWDEYFLGMAHYVSVRSHDSQTKVGCVIVGSPNVVVGVGYNGRSEEHTSELQSLVNLVCRLLLEKKKQNTERKIFRHRAHTLTHVISQM